MRWVAGRHHQHPIQSQLLQNLVGSTQMAQVNRVESPSVDSYRPGNFGSQYDIPVCGKLLADMPIPEHNEFL